LGNWEWKDRNVVYFRQKRNLLKKKKEMREGVNEVSQILLQ
jgi:hypothetical protein